MQKIDIEYKPKPKAFVALFKFAREKVPGIKFYNPQFVFSRRVLQDGPVIPKVRVLSDKNELLEEFDGQKYKTVEELLHRLKELDDPKAA